MRARVRAWIGAVVAAGLLGAAPAAGAAEAGLPERRAIAVAGTDFYGSDLDSRLDTTLERCVAACRGDAACRAVTFNRRAEACFLKSRVAEARPHADALSVRFVEVAPELAARAARRARELDFLPAGLLTAAARLARDLGLAYPCDARAPARLRADAAAARAAGDRGTALAQQAMLTARSDAVADWRVLAGDYLARAEAEGEDGKTWRDAADATAAAVSAYLRAEEAPDRAAALDLLARGLEARGQGRLAIPALRLAERLAPEDRRAAELQRVRAAFGPRIVGHSVESDAAAPRICLTFSEPLVEGNVDYASYVRVAGAELPVEAEGRQACVDGVDHGARYRVTVRAGLPAASGETVARTSTLELYVRDRTPEVRFPGRAYVLPKRGPVSIPLVGVNVGEVELAIYRIGARNLLPAIHDGLFAGPIDRATERRLETRMAAPVWSGRAEVDRRLNQDVVTAVPLGDAVTAFEPGAYAVTARVPDRPAPDRETVATQWFVVTDIGLTTVAGSDGLHVFARALSDAAPLDGLRLELLAANNEVLGTAVADGRGYARFAPGLLRGAGGTAPALLTAENGTGDFAFLDLSEPGFDLTDRGVDGRPAPGPIDLFLSTDRGVYRPGERMHATVLARDARGRALPELPLTAIVTRPDGVEHRRTLLDGGRAGGYAYALDLPPEAQRGTWRLDVHADPKAPALAGAAVLVEDFVPERIDVDLRLAEGPVGRGAPPTVGLSARYLYGAPAAGLAIEGETRVAATRTLDAFPGFRFGLADAAPPVQAAPVAGDAVTDEAGAAEVALRLPELRPVTAMRELTAVIRVRDTSGRPVERTATRLLLPDGPRLGVRPLFDGAAEDGGLARFEVIAVGPDGGRTALDEVAWTLSRVHTDYQWYEADGRWRYEPVTTRERVASGATALPADAPAVVEAPVDWGRYVLELEAPAGPYTAASAAFSAGWHAVGARADTPDLLEVGLDQPAYRVGDTARVRLAPRHAGTALVMAVDDGLVDWRAVEVTPGEAVVELPVTEAWGTGTYVVASLIRPMDVDAGRNPARALGLGWAGVEPGARRLEARFDAPAETAPRRPLEVALEVDGLAAGQRAYATIAAVDLGILNVTGFAPPAPDAWYFGQRRLGADLRDFYGRLIDGMQGVAGRLKSGGDGGFGGLRTAPPSRDLVAFFDGPVGLDEDGRATARFDLPAFNGTLRLMAVVWTAEGVGHAVHDLRVADPVVVSLARPRFLAPGDTSRLQVDLAHRSGPAGEMTLEVTADPALRLAKEDASRRLRLAEGGRAQLRVPVAAAAVGDPEVTVALTTPDGRRLVTRARLPIRANDPAVARTTRLTLPADGGRMLVGADAFTGLRADTVRATLALGPLARFDVPGLLAALDRYPYGCTEQLTSRALPLLYYDRLARASGLDRADGLDARIATAIRRVLAHQSAAGGFGSWQPGQGDLWLAAYASDFLSRARAAGHAVPERAFRAALDNLANRVGYAGDLTEAGVEVAYALMVLAREGRAAIGDLRYLADAQVKALTTPLAKAQLARALALYGEQGRADRLFRLAARQALAAPEAASGTWRADYGSRLRDAAGVLALAAEAGSQAVDRDRIAQRLAQGLRRGPGSTQEMAWALLAARALVAEAAAGDVTIDGRPAEGPVTPLTAERPARAIAVANRGEAPVELVLTAFGVPESPPPAAGNGYRISRRHYTLDGEPVDLAAVEQNARLVTVVTVTAEPERRGRLIVDDPLPAGFEIENPTLLRAGQLGALAWLDTPGGAYLRHSEVRDQRLLAQVDLPGGKRVALAYVMRAVSPGRFHHPAALVEDMYRPAFRARTAAGTVEVRDPAR